MARQKSSSNGNMPSALDRIRAKREQIASDTTEIFDIPGYDGELCARYRRMEWTEIRRVAERATNSRHPQKELHGQADVIAAACVELLIRPDRDNDPEKFERLGEVDGEPVRFDVNLAQMMGWEGVTRPRDIVRSMFGNDMAVSMHHANLINWMSGQSKNFGEEEDGLDPNFEMTQQSEPQVST